MRIRSVILALPLILICASHASAQTHDAANAPYPGVKPVRQIDRAEVRITRVELQPGAVRRMHTHNDVRFHLFIPAAGEIELTIGSARPVEAAPGQAYFMETGTMHGFRNIGSTPAMVMEVFVKDVAATARKESSCPAGLDEVLLFSQLREIEELGQPAPVPSMQTARSSAELSSMRLRDAKNY
jgi:quercetin dioxygenase-like cupin family protein